MAIKTYFKQYSTCILSDVNMFYLDYFEVTRPVHEIFSSSSPQKSLRTKQKSKHIQDTGICHIQSYLSQPEVVA